MKTSNYLLLIIFILSMAAAAQAEINGEKGPSDYKGLIEFLHSSRQLKPFLALTEFKGDYDSAAHRANIDFFNSHPQLISQIRQDLGGSGLDWELKELSYRLLYLPEDRANFSGLFLNYCQEVIRDLLKKIGIDSPYSSMIMPSKNLPMLKSGDGITAIIVQDLGREYTAGYQFKGKDNRSVLIRLSGQMAVNEVGAYSSHIYLSPETGRWEVIRDKHTIWQSRAENPYTVLITPLEETLHIALRKYTERAILSTLEKNGNQGRDHVLSIVDEWLAIEEAVVGGLVETLAPNIIGDRFPNLSLKWIKANLMTKAKFEKYCFLDRGIKIVQSLGVRESYRQYSESPEGIRRLLLCEYKASAH